MDALDVRGLNRKHGRAALEAFRLFAAHVVEHVTLCERCGHVVALAALTVKACAFLELIRNLFDALLAKAPFLEAVLHTLDETYLIEHDVNASNS